MKPRDSILNTGMLAVQCNHHCHIATHDSILSSQSSDWKYSLHFWNIKRKSWYSM